MHTRRVAVTPAAIKVIEQLREEHGPLMFHQSGGCCDGSSPMCYPEGDLMLDDSDIWLGQISGCDFYISRDQYEYWKHTKLTIDVVPGRGSSFSLEIPLGVRFLIRSRLFTESESQNLQPVYPATQKPGDMQFE
ncbi:MAG: DUF779 domain-containing protein [Flavobacteriaceae bacterium]|jgi:uncharacterized protein (DUF779 family)|nr:MAG: DUF779 domain-containing protein [Flavobacteriaceae bacterium]